MFQSCLLKYFYIFLRFFCVIEKAVCTVSIRTVSLRDQPRHLFEGDVQGMRRTGGTTDDLECAEVVGFILRRRCSLGPNRFSSNQRVYRRVREFADQRQSDGNRADTFHGEAWRVWETLFLDRRWSDLCPAPVCSRGAIPEQVLGIHLSLGSVQSSWEEVGAAVAEPCAELEEQLPHEPVINSDER